MRYYITFIFTILWIGVIGQTVNPFDIRDTRASTSTSIANTTIEDTTKQINSNQLGATEIIEPSVDNPFEIGANKERVIAPTPAQINKQTIETTNGSNPPVNKGLIAIFCFINLVLISFSFTTNRSRFMNVVTSIYNSNSLKNLYRSAKSWLDLQGSLLYLAFILSASLFLFLLSKNGWLNGSLISWWLFPLGLLLIYSIRHLFMAFFAYVFPMGTTVEIQNYSISVHNMIISLILFPMVLGMTFGPEGTFHIFALIGLTLSGIIYFLRQIKGVLMVITMRGFNPIYFFIYLCAVEIAPFLIVLRLVSSGI